MPSRGAGPQYLLDTNSKLRKQREQSRALTSATVPRERSARSLHASGANGASGRKETSHGPSSPSSPPPPPPPPPPRSGLRSGPATKPLKPARPPVRQFSAWLGRKDDRTKKSKSPAQADAQSTPALRSGSQPTPGRPSPSPAPRTVEELLPNRRKRCEARAARWLAHGRGHRPSPAAAARETTAAAGDLAEGPAGQQTAARGRLLSNEPPIAGGRRAAGAACPCAWRTSRIPTCTQSTVPVRTRTPSTVPAKIPADLAALDLLAQTPDLGIFLLSLTLGSALMASTAICPAHARKPLTTRDSV